MAGFIVLDSSMGESSENVLVLGASDCPERYAYKVMIQLLDQGHHVILVHPRLQEIEGRPVVASLSDVEDKVDTVTLYVNPSISEPLAEALIALNPQRVIFNPGTESPVLAKRLQDAGISTEDACTLVLLGTGQF
ncbi:MAG: putative CoA-binding protein [Verrucomicrobiales bacterium]